MLELLYTFEPIWTNLLTQCTQLPVPVFCCFCISGFPAIKSSPKIPEKFYKKNQHPGRLRNHQGRRQGLQKGPRRDPTLGRVGHPPGCPVAPLGAPFVLYLVPAEETPKIDLLFPFSSLYRHRCRFKIGAARRSCPGCAMSSPLVPWVRDQ